MKPKRMNWPDGCSAEIHDDGQWDLTLPSGKHVRGIEGDSLQGQAAVVTARRNYILTQWEQGTPNSINTKQMFIVPLT